jgi:energy-coupling factor transporter transmembrane protein EcfT
MFRSLWAKTVGLTDQEAHDLARTWTPHLLSVAACLLFAYCVASLLAWLGTRTIWRGIQIAVSLWLLITGALLMANQWNFGPNFVWIEGGYTLLGALIVGGVVGGLPRRVFIKDTD